MIPVLLLLLAIRVESTPVTGTTGGQNAWPDRCCRLKYVNHTLGDPLPDDAVIWGVMNGKRYAYTVYAHGFGHMGYISEDPNERPYILYNSTYACDRIVDPSVKSVVLLRNPKKCTIRWYTSPKSNPKHPKSPNFYFLNETLVAPTFNPPGTFFYHSSLGRIQYKGTYRPGYNEYKGFTYFCEDDTYHRWGYEGFEIMGINCPQPDNALH